MSSTISTIDTDAVHFSQKNEYSDDRALITLKSNLETPAILADRYTFIKQLGRGSQGNVYLAKRHSDGKLAAVKKLRISSVKTWKEYDLFHREAQTLASIHEDCVAEFYEAVETLDEKDPAAYIIQEYIEGRSLSVMLAQGYRFTVRKIFEMAYNLTDLLQRLHEHNPPIIHRDIKPSNIIMKPTQGDTFLPYLIDFGAVSNPQVQAGGSTVAGTYGYMPPEQLVGKPCAASDFYALAAMIVHLLSGVSPADMRIADFRLVIDPHLENIPRPVVSVLHRILEPRVEERLSDPEVLKSIFAEFANDCYAGQDQFLQDNGEIIDDLPNVQCLSSSGNMDIWMALAERIPRRIPVSIIDRIFDLQSVKTQLAEYHKAQDSFSVLVISCILLFVLGFVGLSQVSLMGRGLGIGCWALLGFCIWWGKVHFSSKTKHTTTKESSFQTVKQRIIAYNHQEVRALDEAQRIYQMMACSLHDESINEVMRLLMFGRKTIATIVSFEYVPFDELAYIKSNNELNHNSLKYGDLISIGKAVFLLRYRFNPPDDSLDEDLVHEIVLHSDDGENLEPGSPLPILYYVKDNNKIVSSMPYPLPLVMVEEAPTFFCVKVNEQK